MKAISKEQYKIVLESAKKDIQFYKEDVYQIEQYTLHKNMLERSIVNKMNANNLNELGGLRLEQEKYFDNIEINELLELFLDEKIAKSIQVSVDIPATEKHLREKFGFTDVAIKPIIDILKNKLTTYRDILVIEKR